MTGKPGRPRGPNYTPPVIYNHLIHCGNPERAGARTLLERQLAKMEKKRAKIPDAELETLENAIEGIRATIAQYKQAEKPCTRGKGWGTNHLGRGLCYIHCECRGEADGHPANSKLGIYGGLQNPKILENIGAMVLSGKDPDDLAPDILLMRAVVLDRAADADMGEVVKSIEALAKLIERNNTLKLKAAVSLDAVTILQQKMAQVVQAVIHDPELVEKICIGWAAIDPISPEAQLKLAE